MEEFSGIAIWILVVFLLVNTLVVWTSASPSLAGTGFVVPQQSEQTIVFGLSKMEEIEFNFFNIIKSNCSTVSSSDLAYGPCFVQRTFYVIDQMVTGFWNFSTAWVNLISVMFTGVPGGGLFISLFTFIFGAIQISAIGVLLMKIAGIVRGGS
jgi:hypothetical protein